MEKFTNDKEAVDNFRQVYKDLKDEIAKAIVGQEENIKLVLMSIFCQGHSLLVGVPGLAKTLLVQTISKILGVSFNRIQFTPDLMPSDILGAETIDKDRNFQFIKGPIFANIILADEINRTPPKTQSALLECMQEYAVTVAGRYFQLSKPFFVLATQNPIEQEGTYPLPEAQLDRFMFNLYLDYPSYDNELEIVKRTTTDEGITLNRIIDQKEIMVFQHLVRKVPVADNVIEYAVRLVNKTRPQKKYASDQANEYLEWGAGPRASQYLILAAKCQALIENKYAPDIEDVQAIAVPVLRHRIVRNFKAEAERISEKQLINELL